MRIKTVVPFAKPNRTSTKIEIYFNFATSGIIKL